MKTKILKKFGAGLLAFMMMLTLMPTTNVHAEAPEVTTFGTKVMIQRTTPLNLTKSWGDPVDNNGQIITGVDGVYDRLNSEGWKWDSNADILTLNGADFNTGNYSALILQEETTLILEGENSLVCMGAPTLVLSKEVTIKGSGKVSISSGQFSGIAQNGGMLNIESGIFDIDTKGSAIISMGGINISGGEIDASCSEDVAIWAVSNIAITGGVIKANSANSNGIGTDENLSISNGADITATGYYPGLWSKTDISITDSTVVSTSTADWGVWSSGTLSIVGDSDVTANGATGNAGGFSGFNIIPKLNESVEVFVGIDADNNTAVQGSPFSAETNLKALNIGNNNYFHSKTHIHTYETTLSKDANKHWYASTCGHDVKKDEADHTFEEWVVDTEATETEKGSKHRDCSVCGHRETEEISVVPHTHTPATDWTKNETSHWHECTANDGHKMDLNSHTFGAWVIDTEATETEKGSKHRDCSICGHRETEEISEVPHTHMPATDWTKNETSHWHECTANDGHKMDLNSHTFGVWGIDTEATETEKGSKHRDCSVCGHRETEEIPVTGEAPAKPTITVGGGFSYQVSAGKDMTLTCSGKLEDLTSIYVDGKLVDPINYTLKSGSTILTLKASYLDTLSAGKHTLTFQYKDNVSVETNFTITAKAGEIPVKPNSPQTGDTSNTMLYLGLIVLSGCVAGFGFKKKKSLNR